MKDIKGFEGLYAITRSGQIWSYPKHDHPGRWMKLGIGNPPYPSVHLSSNNERKQFWVHRLVAEAYIPNPNNLPCVNHMNGVKADNRVRNLEWCTKQQNSKHAYELGLLPRPPYRRGEQINTAKLTEDDVRLLRMMRDLGYSRAELAQKFELNPAHITAITTRRIWKHLE